MYYCDAGPVSSDTSNGDFTVSRIALTVVKGFNAVAIGPLGGVGWTREHALPDKKLDVGRNARVVAVGISLETAHTVTVDKARPATLAIFSTLSVRWTLVVARPVVGRNRVSAAASVATSDRVATTTTTTTVVVSNRYNGRTVASG